MTQEITNKEKAHYYDILVGKLQKLGILVQVCTACGKKQCDCGVEKGYMIDEERIKDEPARTGKE